LAHIKQKRWQNTQKGVSNIYKYIGARKTKASTYYWRRQNIGSYKTLGVDKTLAHKKYLHTVKLGIRQCLVQEKVVGDAEALPYC
jgi:hypothetical protein